MAILTTLNRMSSSELPGHSPVRSRGRHAASAGPMPPVARNGSVVDREPDSPSGKAKKGSKKLATAGGRPLSAWTNIELIAAVRDDDSNQAQSVRDPAFAELYRRHKAEIFTYCLRMMSGDEDAASDLFQDVFIRAYEKAGQFRSGTNVTGWLFMIARNMCLNALRTKRPCDRIDSHPMLANRDRSLAPEYDEEQHTLRQKLEEALQALPIDFREAFMLREFDGFSYSEIATMTGTTLAMTKVRIYRAKQRMRELLTPYLAE